jgi:hypothetical protein
MVMPNDPTLYESSFPRVNVNSALGMALQGFGLLSPRLPR